MLGFQFCGLTGLTGLTGLVILTANLPKYLHVLKIEGEIALLSLFCNNCYTAQRCASRRNKN